MGFETVSMARIDEKEKQFRKENQLLEFMWQANLDGKTPLDDTGILTHIMHEMYNAPCGMDMNSE